VENRPITDQQYTGIDTFRGTGSNYDNEMEAVEGHPTQRKSSVGNFDLRNLDETGSRRPPTPTPYHGANEGGATINRSVQGVGPSADLCPLSH
jgi:hypothetical protein